MSLRLSNAQSCTVFVGRTFKCHGAVMGPLLGSGTTCGLKRLVLAGPFNPSGVEKLTIPTLAVALSSQLLEAFVGFEYWKRTATKTAPTLAVSVFEALGVLAVSSVLLSLPGFFNVSEETPRWLSVAFWSSWSIIIIVVCGVLAETKAEFSNRAARQLPHLGAVGNGLIWLGAALLEIAATSYIIWEGDGPKDVITFAKEIAFLFALELLAVVSIWIARGLWTRVKLLRSSVRSLTGPLRTITVSTRAHFNR